MYFEKKMKNMNCFPNAETQFSPIDGTLIKKATFVSTDIDYMMCNRCVMDTTDPDISFNEEGVCSHCSSFDEFTKPVWPSPEKGESILAEMIQQIKRDGRGKEYDCIIGLSGGVDSSFLATKVKEWGLRPLVVHVDAGWNSELAVKNIEQICKNLDFDLITHVVYWEQMRQLQLSFLRSGLANQDVPQDHAFFAALYGYAIKAGIKNVINGSNFATESILPSSWGYDAMDAVHLRSIHKQFGNHKLKNFPVIGFFTLYFIYPFLYKMKIHKPLNLIDYDKNEAIRYLEQKCGWRYYGGKHYESRWTRFFQAYYLPYKFGYDKRKAHLSSLILSGQLNREEALKELAKPLYDETLLKEDLEFVAKKLGISTNELTDLIEAKPSHYTEFPNHQVKKNQSIYAFGVVRSILQKLSSLVR